MMDKIKELLAKWTLNLISDYTFQYMYFLIRMKRIPNFKDPTTFNEKLCHLKIFQKNPSLKFIGDRFKVREFLQHKNFILKYPKILWKGKNLKEKEYHLLPNIFVAKANHGSGMTKIISKKAYSLNRLNNLFYQWIQKDYHKIGREWIYENSNRIIIIEELLLNENKIPYDYKFFVLNGRVELIQIDIDRFTHHTRNLYSRNLKRLDVSLYYPKSCEIKLPKKIKDAIEISEKIGKTFVFIRVDLYIIKNKIYFGELTLFPGNCTEAFCPYEFDYFLGSKLNLTG